MVRSYLLGCLVALAAFPALAAEPKFAASDWPFVPLARPATPAMVPTGPDAASPIDFFLEAKFAEKNVIANPPADRMTLLRRLSFDLRGLPPTVEEQEAFAADTLPDAYERLVEHWLASPEFGERAAQHWLDVVRYTESDGYKSDTLRQNAYRYRDYVIRAFNSDLPYDRFIAQQLAGDELEPTNPEALAATGYLRLYPEDITASDMRQSWQDILDDVTDVTGMTFLGLTVGCAKCHDHKFDPILQSDFYRLQACFAAMVPDDEKALATSEEQVKYRARMNEWETATGAVRKQMDELVSPKKAEILSEVKVTYDAETQKAMMTPPEQRDALQRQLAQLVGRFVNGRMNRAYKRLGTDDRAKWDALQAELDRHNAEKPAPLPCAASVSESGRVPEVHVLATGNYRTPLAAVVPGFPKFLGASSAELGPQLTPGTTGRRAALAKWLGRPDHPLTARVMVNRIWQQHFGQGLVATTNDFGLMGAGATHPELLDWLASELVSHGWHMKHIHRLILTSAAYRRSSRVEAADENDRLAQKADPHNHLLWHYPRRRLDGEALRDAMLSVAGELNSRSFGPSARPPLPASLMESRYSWEADPLTQDQNRRSIYVLARRNLRYPLLGAFDSPDGFNSCPQRMTTTTAPQALVLLNGEFASEQARQWAGDLLAEHGSRLRETIDEVYREAYARHPAPDEMAAAQAFVESQTHLIDKETDIVPPGMLPSPPCPLISPEKAAAIVDFCHAVLNSTEFMYVD